MRSCPPVCARAARARLTPPRRPGPADFDEPQALAVLLEEELVVLDLQTPGWPAVPAPYLAPLHSSAITCSAHVANVPAKLWARLVSAGEQQSPQPASAVSVCAWASLCRPWGGRVSQGRAPPPRGGRDGQVYDSEPRVQCPVRGVDVRPALSRASPSPSLRAGPSPGAATWPRSRRSEGCC